MERERNFVLHLVDVKDLRTFWPQIRGMVEVVRRKTEQPWLTEDVYNEIITGRSGLYVSFGQEGEVTGLIVCKVAPTTAKGSSLFVWICYHREKGVTIRDYLDYLVEIAKQLNCKVINTESLRPYDRAIPGFKLVSYNFEYEVAGHGQQNGRRENRSDTKH